VSGARVPGVTRFTVAASRPYPVSVGPGALAELAGILREVARVAVIADRRALELHGERLHSAGGLGTAPTHPLPAGEAAKTWGELERAVEFLAREHLDRGACVVAFGGGAALDLAGLAASLYLRGVDVVHCPTTLLAMADASIGGKTAINLAAGRNLAGAFHQPRGVIADVEVLATLPDAELRSGLGEVVKCAVIEGEPALARLESRSGELLARDPARLAEVVLACARLKAAIVEADERERGPREALNLGHTFAHAIEHAAGAGVVPHGSAVAVGIVLALSASERLGLLEDPELPARVARLLERLGLPTSIASLGRAARALRVPAILAAMAADKKARAGTVRLVLPARAGKVHPARGVDPVLLAAILAG
jgi:3-dehydroquinate synthase